MNALVTALSAILQAPMGWLLLVPVALLVATLVSRLCTATEVRIVRDQETRWRQQEAADRRLFEILQRARGPLPDTTRSTPHQPLVAVTAAERAAVLQPFGVPTDQRAS